MVQWIPKSQEGSSPGHEKPGPHTPGHGKPGAHIPGHGKPGACTPGHEMLGAQTPACVQLDAGIPDCVKPGGQIPGHEMPGGQIPGHGMPGGRTVHGNSCLSLQEDWQPYRKVLDSHPWGLHSSHRVDGAERCRERIFHHHESCCRTLVLGLASNEL